MKIDKIISPPRLKTGDMVRVVAPSRSMSVITAPVLAAAAQVLSGLGLKVSFGAHAEESDEFFSGSIASRLTDMHDALKDPDVAAILTVIGGFNANQLLEELDYDLFRSHPKILCGFSDITALQNAVYARAGVMTYSGPHFSTLGMELGLDYTLEYFRKCLFSGEPFEVVPSREWSDDPWYLDQKKRTFIPNPGPWAVRSGRVEGRIVGGNLCTFNLLHGTPYMPDLEGSVLFLEDDECTNDVEFDRDLQSILQQPSFGGVRGIVLGRFQKGSGLTAEKLSAIFKGKKKTRDLPVLAGVDFGHTTPHITFPIGGIAVLNADPRQSSLLIREH